MKNFLTLLLIGLGSLSFAAAADDVVSHKDWSYRELGLTPIQSGGRIKPLDSFARETVLFETGSRSFEGYEPIELMLSWIANPKYWEDHAFIQIQREDVKRQLGFNEKQMRFTPREIFENFPLAQYAESLNRKSQGAETQTNPVGNQMNPRDQELKRLLNRTGLFKSIITGEAWLLIPPGGNSSQPWLSLAAPANTGELIKTQFVGLLKSYLGKDAGEFTSASRLVRAAVEGEIPGYSEKLKNVVSSELFFNRLHPFMWAWILYLVASFAFVFAISEWGGVKSKRLAITIMSAGLGLHVLGFALRCYIAGRPPVTNMYESIIWVSFGVMLFASVIYVWTKQGVILAVSCALAALGLIAGDSAPAMLDSSIQPLVPVLRSNYWLTIHVLTITLGYAAFALTLGLANLTLFNYLKGSATRKAAIMQLNQLTYRAMQFGVVLLAAGTILGGIWADYSWGRFWGWDPKEVWALIALLAYVVILHARFTNWIGQFGFAVWTVCSFLTVLMAWYGVNFVLGVGLHSYGFSAGGRGWVFGFVVLQLIYVGIVAVKEKFYRRVSAPLAATS